MKEIKNEIKRDIRLEDSILYRCELSSDCYMSLTQFPWKSYQDVFVAIDKIILKFIWKGKGDRIGKWLWKWNWMTLLKMNRQNYSKFYMERQRW